MITHSFLYSLLVKIDLVFFGLNPESLLKLDWQSLESSGNSVVGIEMTISCAVAKKMNLMLNLGRLGSVFAKTKMSVSRAAVGKTGLMLGPCSMSLTTLVSFLSPEMQE